MQTQFLDNSIQELPFLEAEDCAMALGFFDGIHLGHQHIIRKAKEIAREKGLQFALMTFTPHPTEVITPDSTNFPYLTTLSEKVKKMASLGVEQLYIVKFNTDFCHLSPQEFVKQYLVGLRCKHVIAGFDFTYGYKGAGNMSQLTEYAQGEFEVTTVAKIERNHRKISSTLIRELVKSGRVDLVPEYLGQFYEINGQVLSISSQNGDTDSIIHVITSCFLPRPGVYTIAADINGVTYEGTCIEIHTFESHSMLVLQLDSKPPCIESSPIVIKWTCLRQEKPLLSTKPIELSSAVI
ncbi:FAD synthetase family protein [Paenibacillus albiflavus]|uniref:FAD synthase n=1 Tax=Paenibacillus albiflavus TaxID=2545760 RepID=A0A4R4EDF8_9BACL|nr:FAD synthetase family protein [Paenibacillus albiflavus]TCZ77759.1 FAD synthetase family protein [Paenibacillus albiflavus]